MTDNFTDKSLPAKQIFNGKQCKDFSSLTRKGSHPAHAVLLHIIPIHISMILEHTHSREPSRLTVLSRLIWTHVTLQGKGEVISKTQKTLKCQLLSLSKLHLGSNQLKPKGKSLSYQERCFVEHLFPQPVSKKVELLNVLGWKRPLGSWVQLLT